MCGHLNYVEKIIVNITAFVIGNILAFFCCICSGVKVIELISLMTTKSIPLQVPVHQFYVPVQGGTIRTTSTQQLITVGGT